MRAAARRETNLGVLVPIRKGESHSKAGAVSRGPGHLGGALNSALLVGDAGGPAPGRADGRARRLAEGSVRRLSGARERDRDRDFESIGWGGIVHNPGTIVACGRILRATCDTLLPHSEIVFSSLRCHGSSEVSRFEAALPGCTPPGGRTLARSRVGEARFSTA